MPRKDEEVEPEVINFTWIFESQSSKATAFLLSKGFWPLPEDWQPKMDFERHALSFNGSVPNVDSNGGIGGMNLTEPQTLWITCAEQYEECACYGKIRWGIEGRWIYIPPSTAETANRIRCEIGKQKDVPELIDVNPGDASKHCECQVSTASYFFQHVNVVALPKRERKQMQLEEGSNCPLLAADMTEAGRILWKGIEGICNSNWTEIPAGSKSIPPKKLTAMVKTYVPTNFAVNYHHFYRDGWLPRALVSYFNGPLEGAQSQAIEMLIESVHRFSVYPIVVLHGGMATPVHWNPEIYPRLVLLSMAELPPVAGFGATQLAAAVISHVQTGILLSYGALVFPGIDRFFAAAEREIHALYPYPILTASYFEREVHTEAYWTHVCAEGLGCNQSMHWSQLEGISWSFYALDFLASTLRSMLRDEAYSAEAPYVPLRVRRTRDVETLMNLALWKAGANKQWCKLDLDVSEVLQWLDLEGATGGDCRKSICSPIPGGPGGPGAFYPKGIPRIFVSMGPTNELKRSREILEKVEKLKRRHALPRPILFQKAYRTGDEARKDWPDMGCLL